MSSFCQEIRHCSLFEIKYVLFCEDVSGNSRVAPSMENTDCLTASLEECITKLTFYHIRCFLLSKDAFTPNLAEIGPVS